MDTAIEAEVQLDKRKKIIIVILFSVILLGCAWFLLRYSVSSSVKKSSITTAVVETGNIENTITATGEILPEFEEIIASPINASVQNVLLDAGLPVKVGQSVLTLDKAASQTEFERLKFGLESKQNDIKKLRLQLDKSFYDIKSSNSIKQLRINSLQADVENTKRLFKAGGGTREDIEKAELALKVATLEKLQLENEIKNKQQTMEVEMREATIAAAIQQNDLSELERKLKLANIVASRDGVVTWLNKNIGATVREGETLARIANLSSFKVQGTISDNYLDQLHNGMYAIIRINETQLRGTVVNIQPAVQNGVASFNIQLEERNNKLLRPNLKADVFLVTAAKTNVLRVANGPAFKGIATQDIFVVNNGKAEKRTVHTGLSNFDFVELKDNVKAGDVIITSDMEQYKNTKEITINN
ncbi:MAG: HlyD family efflux transporter periplasmic adaptor subunit [Ferruginibacter sp.]|uniref:efflux RND transporter periplasmic adaptor subunit n=1 Tax=Ferruginibacter sp. TaxID=1940288 RepID=UPI0026580AD6|nr:HlyD family efflux transporter periplasmic adaptor subunit [Ferruginibacter sp.]MDB5279555.1 HlyD family efflux transporter periplasmic adaptor subunit [Ferruginibacter sp.]